MTARRSEFFGIFEKLDDAFEQTTGAAAVDAAMVETQGDLRFSFWYEFVFCFVPRRDLFTGAKAEQQCLVGQWNRRTPFHPENAEIRNRGDATGLHVGRNPPLSREFDQFPVFCGEIGKRGSVRATNYRNHNSVFSFNSNS